MLYLYSVRGIHLHIKTDKMTTEFTYFTITQGEKRVLLYDTKIHGTFLVEVIPDTGMADKIRNYKFDTLEGAVKKFNSIKKRVANKIG